MRKTVNQLDDRIRYPTLFRGFLVPIFNFSYGYITTFNRMITILVWLIGIVVFCTFQFFIFEPEQLRYYRFIFFVSTFPIFSIAVAAAFALPFRGQFWSHYICAAGILFTTLLAAILLPAELYGNQNIVSSFGLFMFLGFFSIYPKPLGALSIIFCIALNAIYFLAVNDKESIRNYWFLANLILLIAFGFSIILRAILYDWSRALVSKNSRINELTETNALLNITLNANRFGLVGFDREKNLVLERGTNWRKIYGIQDASKPRKEWKTLKKLINKKVSGGVSSLLQEVGEMQVGHQHFLLRAYELDDLLVITHLEISDLREVEAELRIKQKLALIGEITSGVAHNYNNTLAIALSNLETFPEEKYPEIYDAIIQPSIAAIEQSADISHKLLALAGRQNLSQKSFDVSKALNQMRALILSAAGTDVQLTISARKPIFINTDPSEFESAILNLILNARNALKTTPGKIKISAYTSDGYAVVSVKDNGHGIPPAIQDKIFDPFFTTKNTPVSSGLGLSTVKGFVQQSKGFVSLKSSQKGTVFKLHFPICNANETKTSKESLTEMETKKTNFVEMVLLVDDNEQVVESFIRLLKSMGYPCHGELSALQAIEYAKAHKGRISHAFLDHSMPEMNGVDLGVALKSIDPNIRLYLLTGETNIERTKKAQNSGFAKVLIKPLRARELVDVLGSVKPKNHTTKTPEDPHLIDMTG